MTPHAIIPLGCWLLGQTHRIRNMGERFRTQGPSLSIQQVLFWTFLIAIVAVAIWWAVRMAAMRDGRSYTSHKRLFQDLCRVHELDWPSRRLLRQIAKVHRLQPAHVFLQPALFNTQNLHSTLEPLSKQIEALGKRLFAKQAT